jgi:hypothetical protein
MDLIDYEDDNIIDIKESITKKIEAKPRREFKIDDLSSDSSDDGILLLEKETIDDIVPSSRKRRAITTPCDSCETLLGSKYTCPGCDMKSCSAKCVTEHKQVTGCSGKRDRAAAVSAKEYGQQHLEQDYSFLEEISRSSFAAKRLLREYGTMVTTIRVPITTSHNITNRGGRDKSSGYREKRQEFEFVQAPARVSTQLHLLLRAARSAGVNLRLMPRGFNRHEENTSKFVVDRSIARKRKKMINLSRSISSKVDTAEKTLHESSTIVSSTLSSTTTSTFAVVDTLSEKIIEKLNNTEAIKDTENVEEDKVEDIDDNDDNDRNDINDEVDIDSIHEHDDDDDNNGTKSVTADILADINEATDHPIIPSSSDAVMVTTISDNKKSSSEFDNLRIENDNIGLSNENEVSSSSSSLLLLPTQTSFTTLSVIESDQNVSSTQQSSTQQTSTQQSSTQQSSTQQSSTQQQQSSSELSQNKTHSGLIGRLFWRIEIEWVDVLVEDAGCHNGENKSRSMIRTIDNHVYDESFFISLIKPYLLPPYQKSELDIHAQVRRQLKAYSSETIKLVDLYMKKNADSNQWSEIPNDVFSNILSAAESRIAIFLRHPYAQNGKTVYKRVSLFSALSTESILSDEEEKIKSILSDEKSRPFQDFTDKMSSLVTIKSILRGSTVIEYPTFVIALINNQCEDPIKELLNRFPLYQAMTLPVLPKKQNIEESFGISSVFNMHQSDPSYMNLSSSSSSRGEGGRGSSNDNYGSRGGRGQGRGGWQGGESRGRGGRGRGRGRGESRGRGRGWGERGGWN